MNATYLPRAAYLPILSLFVGNSVSAQEWALDSIVDSFTGKVTTYFAESPRKNQHGGYLTASCHPSTEAGVSLVFAFGSTDRVVDWRGDESRRAVFPRLKLDDNFDEEFGLVLYYDSASVYQSLLLQHDSSANNDELVRLLKSRIIEVEIDHATNTSEKFSLEGFSGAHNTVLSICSHPTPPTPPAP